MSVAPVQDKFVEDEIVPEALKVGAVGAVVSGAKVVTFTVLLAGEREGFFEGIP